MSNNYQPPFYPPPQPQQPLPPYQPQPAYQPFPTPLSSYPPGPPKKRSSFKLLLTCLVVSVLALCTLVTMGSAFFTFLFPRNEPVVVVPTATPRPTVPPLKVYTVVGKPTLNAQFINSVLEYYGSPASGKGQALYDDGIRSGINPAYALAFFLEESNFGTKGIATVTHALGNIRANPGEPQYKGYRSYASWEEGFADWYRLIAKKYVVEWGLSTVDQIIPIYAPSDDHNDEAQYIRTVKWAIERWRNGYFDV
ncbi:MAG TPA: glucosaminidase domain-containing protein [Ktedonosporobacter sp.]|nr:glucosaminidase domain-containing protein [Ktedonosporobacter sp.]